MKLKTDTRDAIVIESTPVAVLFVRFEETADGFTWEIRCYGRECAVQKSAETYRTKTAARASGRAALADMKRQSF